MGLFAMVTEDEILVRGPTLLNAANRIAPTSKSDVMSRGRELTGEEDHDGCPRCLCEEVEKHQLFSSFWPGLMAIVHGRS